MSEMSGTFTADAIGPPVPIPDVPGADAGWIVGDVDGAGLRHLSHPGGE
ncbi:hypothetical protein GR254_14515 [Mycobacterium tuberculosis]|nr:hypothetical protein [Mycobacterium tuberculosis]